MSSDDSFQLSTRFYLYPDALLDPVMDQSGVHPLIAVRNNSSEALRVLVEVCPLCQALHKPLSLPTFEKTSGQQRL